MSATGLTHPHNQNPTGAQWQVLLDDKWEGRVIIDSLLVLGGLRG